jgi:hypothetical protein
MIDVMIFKRLISIHKKKKDTEFFSKGIQLLPNHLFSSFLDFTLTSLLKIIYIYHKYYDIYQSFILRKKNDLQSEIR